jgi:hypothetical protein
MENSLLDGEKKLNREAVSLKNPKLPNEISQFIYLKPL